MTKQTEHIYIVYEKKKNHWVEIGRFSHYSQASEFAYEKWIPSSNALKLDEQTITTTTKTETKLKWSASKPNPLGERWGGG